MLISHIPYSWRLLKTFLHWHLSHGDNMEVSVSHPATSESCPVAPRTQTPLCSLPCCFPSLSQSQWLMAITCAWGVTPSPPAQACLGFITHHFLAHEAAQHLVWLVPHFGSFHFLRALRTSKEGRGKPHPTALGQGLSLPKSKWGAAFSNVHLQNTACLIPVYSFIWADSPLCPADTQDVVCKALRNGLLRKTYFYPLHL